jgi:hypothetical protein
LELDAPTRGWWFEFGRVCGRVRSQTRVYVACIASSHAAIPASVQNVAALVMMASAMSGICVTFRCCILHVQRNYPSLFCIGNLKHRRSRQNKICQITILSFSEDIFVVARPTFLVRLFWQLRNIRNGMLVSEMYNTL